jgi:hypothetical protein
MAALTLNPSPWGRGTLNHDPFFSNYALFFPNHAPFSPREKGWG